VSGLYTIRHATDADTAIVARIWHAGWEDGHLGHVPPELLQFRTPEHFLSRTPERIPLMWIAEAAGAIAGFVAVREDEVEQLFVDRPARGSGVAVLLLRKGEDEIRSAGHTRAWLAVVAGNGRARRFYERCGWRDAGPFTYMAQTPAGPFAVPSRRYEIEL
jgi:GNAT superfamily N-acetyltransferase